MRPALGAQRSCQSRRRRRRCRVVWRRMLEPWQRRRGSGRPRRRLLRGPRHTVRRPLRCALKSPDAHFCQVSVAAGSTCRFEPACSPCSPEAACSQRLLEQKRSVWRICDLIGCATLAGRQPGHRSCAGDSTTGGCRRRLGLARDIQRAAAARRHEAGHCKPKWTPRPWQQRQSFRWRRRWFIRRQCSRRRLPGTGHLCAAPAKRRRQRPRLGRHGSAHHWRFWRCASQGFWCQGHGSAMPAALVTSACQRLLGAIVCIPSPEPNSWSLAWLTEKETLQPELADVGS